jgi:hypothetical protein
MENIENTKSNEGEFTPELVDLNGAQTAQIMGIFSVFLLFFICCGAFAILPELLSLILGIIAFRKGKQAIAEYEANPGMYTKKSFNQAKTAKTTGLISSIVVVLMILSVSVFFGIAIFSKSV